MKKFIAIFAILVAAVLTADAQGLHFMDVEMGSTRDAFNTSFIEKGFSEPQVQGDVEFYKHGTFEGCDSSTVAIYKSPDEKIRRVVAYVNVKDEVEANDVMKNLGQRFLDQNKGYILKDLSANGKILLIYSRKDDYADYIAIEFTAGDKKVNVQYILSQ